MATQTKEPDRTESSANFADEEGYLSRAEVARRCCVGAPTVQGWIDSGELPAVNLAADTMRKPRWFVAPEELEAFLRRRAKVPTAGRMPKRRRRDRPDPESKIFRF